MTHHEYYWTTVITDELTGPALDAAVARALGDTAPYTLPYSTQWDLLGPVMQQYRIDVCYDQNHDAWRATHADFDRGIAVRCYGPTPSVAAMRCLCSAVLGHTVRVDLAATPL